MLLFLLTADLAVSRFVCVRDLVRNMCSDGPSNGIDCKVFQQDSSSNRSKMSVDGGLVVGQILQLK